MFSTPSSLLFVALAVSGTLAVPFQKRIAQTISDSTVQWENTCLAAGGADKCNPVSVTAFSALLAGAGPCDQQNGADAMVNLAKTLGNNQQMIQLSQIFAQQPRNSPNSVSIPYCQQAPRNAELNGLFQCQFAGVDPKTFVGGVSVGGAGTIPFSKSAPVNPPGSCPAHPEGPIADGTQLVDITTNPGMGSATASSGSPSDATAKSGSAKGNNATAVNLAVASVTPGAATTSTAKNSAKAAHANATATAVDASAACDSVVAKSKTAGVGGHNTNVPAVDLAVATDASTTTTNSAAAMPSAATASGDFHLQNGEEAQALNAKFATLSPTSNCSEGETACVKGTFAQCVGGSFVMTTCGGNTTCVALPLVNKSGTSVTCTTQPDAQARITATGATGGIQG